MFDIVLVLSLIISFLNAFLGVFVKWALYICSPKISVGSREEILEIERQMNALSKVVNFAQYIRLERQKNKIIDEQRTEVQKRIEILERRLGFLGYFIQAVVTLISVVLFWKERGRAVVLLPNDWLSPMSAVFSWPTSISGSISYPVWFLITNTVAKIAAKPFT